MTLASGTRIGRYEISEPLGAGGMGEVYRASDAELGREAAIKVLPAAFTDEPARLVRFEREARVLAQLRHPNVATVYGLEAWSGGRALAMELVEGEDLATLLDRGPVPIADALPIALQLAEGLEAAHELGIVHRDLKPANVRLRSDGTVKILDFGLAQSLDPASGPPANVADSPTISVRATELGVVLGTAAYMAPEQARGKPTDRRADIWAFGVVLYEMLCGRRAFAGEHATDVLAAVLRQDVEWTALPRETPPSLRRLLRRCLERDPKTRLRDIGEARVELERLTSGVDGSLEPLAPRPVAWRERLLWLGGGAIAALALAFSAALIGLWTARPDSGWDTRVVRLAFVPPSNVAADEGVYDATVVSPDGSQIVFTGRLAGGRRQLFLRALDAFEARALPGTEEAMEPFWSPDGRSLGFGADGKLKRVELSGGAPQVLAEAPRLTGGTWSRTGVIVFGPAYGARLLQIPATGGVARPAMPGERGAGETESQPQFLPDDRHFLFRGGGAPQRVLVGALDSGDTTALPSAVAAGPVRFAAPDWLLYVRNDALVAQTFDPAHLALSGEPANVATVAAEAAGRGRISVSDNGALVLQNPRALQVQLLWLDRAGQTLGVVGDPVGATAGLSVELSPDGRRAAVQRVDPGSRNSDIWLVDLERGAFDRLTTDPGYDQLPVWMPDGRAVLVARQGLRRVAVDGSGDERLVPDAALPRTVASDGRYAIFEQRGETTRTDLWVLPLGGAGKPYPLLRTPFDEDQAELSPDGRAVAYCSDVTGRREVYVRPVLMAEGGAVRLGEPTLVSDQGGQHPRWRRDGRELYYVETAGSAANVEIVAVSATVRGERLAFGAPEELFATRLVPNALGAEFDVAPDGRRFLVAGVVGESAAPAVSLVLNWTAPLRP